MRPPLFPAAASTFHQEKPFPSASSPLFSPSFAFDPIRCRLPPAPHQQRRPRSALVDERGCNRQNMLTLAWANVLYAKGGNYNAQVVIPDDKPDESLLVRFTREVMKAGVLQECKIRRWFENTVEKKKRKVQDAARKNRRWYVSNFHFFRFSIGKRKLGSFVAFIAKAHGERAKPMEFGWEIAVGSMIGFFGAAFGSVGGVGGGGIFVPMLALIVGFDPKSTTAISKCMIMGAAGSTVYYNLKLRHPSLHMPVIDYDLAFLIQPMLMLGINIGVIFNVVFPDWMVTVLLIVLFIGTSTKAFMKGVDTWKLETILKREAAKRLVPSGVPLLQNIYWKELGLLVFVWMSFLALQIAKVRDLRHELYSYMFHMVLDIKLLIGMMNLFASRCDGGGSSMLVVVHVFTDLGDHSCNHLEI
ncbi:hypothetical protein ZIOFF_034899 [Zingiber officinale]|uniref:Sulfite exporter TauE/SafE family protein n=1 Tax=Zingiber officinale TaxID=94328 RepID=A0A8J5L026_ZINOF|nr:hypothetical protein ZIOFF_034899 [Zingiber officinale]